MPQINLMELAEQSFGAALSSSTTVAFTSCWSNSCRSAPPPARSTTARKALLHFRRIFNRQAADQQHDRPGIYDEVKDQLTAAGHDLNKIEEFEVEPSLERRPGPPGRVLPGFHRHAGLDRRWRSYYHYGLFRQRFVDNQQKAVPNQRLGEQNIRATMTPACTPTNSAILPLPPKLVNIDAPGYDQPTKNRLRLFDLASVDDGLVPGSSIDFDKTEIAKNLTLFLTRRFRRAGPPASHLPRNTSW